MKNIINIIIGAFAVIGLVDLLGFTAWILSGQTPADGFYIGALTANFISLFI